MCIKKNLKICIFFSFLRDTRETKLHGTNLDAPCNFKRYCDSTVLFTYGERDVIVIPAFARRCYTG